MRSSFWKVFQWLQLTLNWKQVCVSTILQSPPISSNWLPIKLLPSYHGFILRFNCWLWDLLSSRNSTALADKVFTRGAWKSDNKHAKLDEVSCESSQYVFRDHLKSSVPSPTMVHNHSSSLTVKLLEVHLNSHLQVWFPKSSSKHVSSWAPGGLVYRHSPRVSKKESFPVAFIQTIMCHAPNPTAE